MLLNHNMKSKHRQASNLVEIPEKVSYLDFILFFQSDFEKVFLQKYDPTAGLVYSDSIQKAKIEVPSIALALRLTVEIFRVLAVD